MNLAAPPGAMVGAGRGWRAAFAGELALVMALATFAGSALPVLSLFVLADFGITRTQLGWLLTIVSVASALVATLAGRVADAVGSRTALVTVFASVGVAAVAIATAPTMWYLAGAMVLAGLPNSFANPVTNRVIAGQLPIGARGVVMGIKQSGVQAGIFLGGVALPPMALAWGWRVALVAYPVLALIGAVLVRRVIPDSVTAPRNVTRSTTPLSPAFTWLAVYAALMGAGSSGAFAFLPLYAQEVLGLDVRVAGLVAGLTGLVGICARIAWARSADRRRVYSWPLGIIAGLAAVASLVVLAAGSSGVWLLWAGAALTGASSSAWNAVAMLAASEHTATAGRATARVFLAFMVGFAAGPVLFGLAVDRTGSYTLAWWGVTVAFIAAAGVIQQWRRAQHRQASRQPRP